MRGKPTHDLCETLRKLNLTTMVEHYETLAREAARDQLPHVDYLARLADIERAARYERSVARRIKRARLPVIKNPRTVPLVMAPAGSIVPRYKICSDCASSKRTSMSCSWAMSGWARPIWPLPWLTPPALTIYRSCSPRAVDIVNTLSAAQCVDNPAQGAEALPDSSPVGRR